MTVIERDFFYTGDDYLRLGFKIFDETVGCMKRTSMVLAKVTNSYRESGYCNDELEQTYVLQKPIILMLKEQADENLMMPAMKLLFRNKFRILWETENNECVLKTTWTNLC